MESEKQCSLNHNQLATLLLALKVALALSDATLMGEILIRLHKGNAISSSHLMACVENLCPRSDEFLWEMAAEYHEYSLRGNPLKATASLVDFVLLLPMKDLDSWLYYLPLPKE